MDAGDYTPLHEVVVKAGATSATDELEPNPVLHSPDGKANLIIRHPPLRPRWRPGAPR